MAENVWIVLVNYNGLEDTCACLESIRKIDDPRLTTIVVDNASSVNPAPRLGKEFPWCRVVLNGINGGWAGGNNVGIREALAHDADYVILLNNDTVVSPVLVDHLLAAAEHYPEYGITGPIINEMHEPSVVQTEGVIFNTPREPGFFSREAVARSNSQHSPALTEVDIVNGCCMMIRRSVFEAVGLIDERFFLIHEESDFCLRTQQAGWKCGVVGESLVWHKHSASFRRAGQRLQRYYDARNLQLLLRNHAQAHQGGRSRAASWLEYYKYVYYCYCFEREQGSAEGAMALLEGLTDGWFHRYGAKAARRRFLVPPLQYGFEAARRLRSLTRYGWSGPPPLPAQGT